MCVFQGEPQRLGMLGFETPQSGLSPVAAAPPESSVWWVRSLWTCTHTFAREGDGRTQWNSVVGDWQRGKCHPFSRPLKPLNTRLSFTRQTDVADYNHIRNHIKRDSAPGSRDERLQASTVVSFKFGRATVDGETQPAHSFCAEDRIFTGQQFRVRGSIGAEYPILPPRSTFVSCYTAMRLHGIRKSVLNTKEIGVGNVTRKTR